MVNYDDLAIFKIGPELCEYFCIQLNEWIEVRTKLCKSRYKSSACSIAGRIYVFGGGLFSSVIEWFDAKSHVAKVLQWHANKKHPSKTVDGAIDDGKFKDKTGLRWQ